MYINILAFNKNDNMFKISKNQQKVILKYFLNLINFLIIHFI